MSKSTVSVLAAASLFVAVPGRAASLAQTVIAYQPGSGYSGSLTNAASALGAPSTVNIDPVWGNSDITPFTPPYLASQIVSVGAGGSLTVELSASLFNDPAHPYGVDFIVYGNTSFFDAEWPNGRTDSTATTFGDNAAPTQVWISSDGAQFYRLNPSLAPVLDGFYPTDGAGTPGVPVNPALGRDAFASQTLAQIRTLYSGSAGGTGFDLAWAQDVNGQAVSLSDVRFIRIDVLGGHAEIDAIAAVPEPGTWLLSLSGLGTLLSRVLWRRRGHQPPSFAS
jgi:hypothetical protein